MSTRDEAESELGFLRREIASLRAALDRLNDDCLRAEQEREQLRTKLAETEAKIAKRQPFSCDECARLEGELSDMKELRDAAEQSAREAEVRGLEKTLELLPTRLGVRVWAEDVRAAINAEIARLTQGEKATHTDAGLPGGLSGYLVVTTDEKETYDCPIHGEGEGKDCPRC